MASSLGAARPAPWLAWGGGSEVGQVDGADRGVPRDEGGVGVRESGQADTAAEGVDGIAEFREVTALKVRPRGSIASDPK